MSLLNKLFKKTAEKKPAAKIPAKTEKTAKILAPDVKKTEIKKTEIKNKPIDFKSDGVLISPLATEKAVSGQNLNKYIFKVAPRANKIDIIRAVSKIYDVKAISANIINIPRKARQVGKTKGFKSGFKKAIVTLAKGQSIEVK